MISLLLALADQGIKRLVDASLSLGESRVIIPGFLNLTYLKNPGGAFSLLAGLPPVWGRAFFIVATLAALVFVYYLYHHNPPESRWGRTGLVLIFGGGLGNLVDRLSTGEVIDFILFYFRGYYWPAFNLADSCITIGVALMAVDVVSGAMRRETPPPEDPDPESADS